MTIYVVYNYVFNTSCGELLVVSYNPYTGKTHGEFLRGYSSNIDNGRGINATPQIQQYIVQAMVLVAIIAAIALVYSKVKK